jgi:hypothetical protein
MVARSCVIVPLEIQHGHRREKPPTKGTGRQLPLNCLIWRGYPLGFGPPTPSREKGGHEGRAAHVALGGPGGIAGIGLGIGAQGEQRAGLSLPPLRIGTLHEVARMERDDTIRRPEGVGRTAYCTGRPPSAPTASALATMTPRDPQWSPIPFLPVCFAWVVMRQLASAGPGRPAGRPPTDSGPTLSPRWRSPGREKSRVPPGRSSGPRR